MLTFLSIVHLFIALVLIVLVLVQDSKGGGLGGGMGGGTSAVIGSVSAENILTKATRWVAVIFALNCIVLTMIISDQSASVTETTPAAISAPLENLGEAAEPGASTEVQPEADQTQEPTPAAQ